MTSGELHDYASQKPQKSAVEILEIGFKLGAALAPLATALRTEIAVRRLRRQLLSLDS